MSIADISKKDLKHCDIVNYWAYSVPLMRQLMKEDGLYLDELFLLSLVYRLGVSGKGFVTKLEVVNNFNVLSYKRDKMLSNLIGRGLIVNDREGSSSKSRFRLMVTLSGEQLLIKYRKALVRLCDG